MEIPEFSAKNDIFYQKLKTIISSNRPQYNVVNICSFEPYFQVEKLRFSIFLVIFDFFFNKSENAQKRRKSGFTIFLVFFESFWTNPKIPQKPRENRIFWKLFPNEPLFETDALLLRGLFCSTLFVCRNELILRFKIWIFRWFFKFLTFLFEDVTSSWWWWWGRRKRLIFETGMIETQNQS